MGVDGGFAAVAVVVQQLLTLVDVSGGDEDEVGDPVDVVKFGLAVSVLTVIYQPTHSTRLSCGVHTGDRESKTVFTFRLEKQFFGDSKGGKGRPSI